MNKKCPRCATFEPHFHPEALLKRPPQTIEGRFISVGLSSDVSFMDVDDLCDVLDFCSKWGNRTFLIQSKNPEYFLQFYHRITSNVIIGTTIECNNSVLYNQGTGCHHHYSFISKAPIPRERYESMLKLNCRKAVTIEPILDFDVNVLEDWIHKVKPELLWIGYANDGHEGKKLKLPEPPLMDTLELINELEEAGIDVRKKTLRHAWWEK